VHFNPALRIAKPLETITIFAQNVFKMKKNLICLLFLSLIFSCAENEQITPEITEPTEGYVEFNFLPKKAQEFIQALAIQPNGRIASSNGTIETDSVLVDFNENDSTTSYTLMIKNENNNKVENLVIHDNDNSVKAYVFEYVPTQEWYSEFQAHNQSFLNYTGEVNIYSYADDELINSFEFEDGEGHVSEESPNGRTNCYELVQMNYYIMDGYLYYTMFFEPCSGVGGGGYFGDTGYDGNGGSNDNDPFGRDGNSGGGGGGSSSAGAMGFDNFSNYTQTFGKLCDNINFQYSAQSFTAEIIGLGGTYYNSEFNYAINVELGINCIDIPEYYIGTSYDAALGFTSVFNTARTQIEHELEWGILNPNTITVRNRLISLISTKLNQLYPGATFGLGECQGNVPQTTADYGC